MSCDQWESGTIKIPSKEYVKFRNSILRKHIEISEQQLAIANKIKKQMDLLPKKELAKIRHWDIFSKSTLELDAGYEYLISSMLEGTKSSPIRALTKKDISLGCLKDRFIDTNGYSISFDDKTKSIYWDVPELNKAVSYAHNRPLVNYLFGLLNNMTWTRNSGGQIMGNDENNYDEDLGQLPAYCNYEYSVKTNKPKHRGMGF